MEADEKVQYHLSVIVSFRISNKLINHINKCIPSSNTCHDSQVLVFESCSLNSLQEENHFWAVIHNYTLLMKRLKIKKTLSFV